MYRIPPRIFLFLFFISTPAFSKADRIVGEWIFYQSPTTRISWKEKALELRGRFQFIKEFGHQNQFGLFKSHENMPKNLPLPKGISFAQPNYIYSVHDALDPEFEKSWGLQNTGQALEKLESGFPGKDIGIAQAWEVFKGSKNTKTAVIDTGIDFTHEDLKSNRDSNEWNFVSNSPNAQDDHGHGTLCAGIIGADAGNGKGTRGVNWKTSLMSIKILDANGTGTTDRAVQGIQYAVNHGAKIINASWGGSNYDQALYETVKWAGVQGVLFVTAAGNDAKDNDQDPYPTYPASFRLPNILSVAAYDNKDSLAPFSSFGKETVHLGAPGVQIYSTMPGGYRFGDGTSFAAPFVAGTAALLLSYVPTLTLAELKERILLSTVPISYYEKERLKTAGRLNAYNALKNIRPARPQTPLKWIHYGAQYSTAHPYVNDTKLSFHFTHPGAKHIRVHFSRFETEINYDKLILKDSMGRTVKTYSGLLEDFVSADALGDSLQIEFNADYAITKYGVDIDGYEISYED